MYNEYSVKFKTQFLELISIARQMKKHIVTFQDGRILGTDETLSSLSIVYYDNEKYDLFKESGFCFTLTFVLNELVAYLKRNNILEPVYQINHFGINHCKGGEILENQFRFANEILNMEMRCRYLMTESDHTVIDYNIKEDQTFNATLELKKKEGSTMYILNNRYIMSTFSSIHPVTKSDKITVDIYELPDKRSFLSKFTIIKKSCIIEEFIKYRFL